MTRIGFESARQALRFLAGFVVGSVLLAPAPALPGEFQFGSSSCVIDNDNSPEANVYLLAGEYRNGDATNDASISCGVPMDSGSDPSDLTSVTVYAYDGNDAQSVAVTLVWHGFIHNDWESCGQELSGAGTTGNVTISFDSGDISGCIDHSDGAYYISVVLPDQDVDYSNLTLIRTTNAF
jgi:hypothetical protein